MSRVSIAAAVLILLLGCMMPTSEDAAMVEEALASLQIDFATGESAHGVFSDVTLPETSENGLPVSWASSQPSYVTEEGTVTRPPNGGGDVDVTLTATAEFNGYSNTREFAVTVVQSYDYTPVPAVNPEPAEIEGLLARINYYRWRVGVPALVWNQTLADMAQAWAESQSGPATKDSDPHTGSGFTFVTEMIYTSLTPGGVSGIQAADAWADYRAEYLYGVPTNGQVTNAQFYSTLVWSATTDFGAGYATDGSTYYVVVRFGPAGNYATQVAYPYAEDPWLDLDNDDVTQLNDADDTDPAVQ
jgi:uncharacterized protein YkwD